ncbi:hypothetical protein [Luteitalea sp.]|uniref:hypothetical protein n=1 Tax=Luteitalea sp. TaxID=2004800 RepID=UPI0037C9F206
MRALRWRWVVGMLVLALWAPMAPSHAQPAAPQSPVSPWFRLFLTDGRVLTTVGEFTRVDDVVLLQVPTGLPVDGTWPEARTITLPASRVDWARTDAYREAMRRAQFEQAGGERAYAAFTEEVAATLRDIALIPDPLERIRRLEAARVRLAQWPAAHHGYRAEDVARTLSVVDDLLNGMRAAAGQQAFSIALTAGPAAPATPTVTLLPPPTLQDVIAQALALAPAVSDAAERLLLLQSAEALLATAPASERRWVDASRRQVRRQIKDEGRVTRRYADLRTWMLDKSARLLAMADVRGLMAVRQDVITRDARLDHRRPAEVASLLATLDARLESARRHRLLIERWQERRPALEAYVTTVTRHLGATAPLPRALEDIKALSGPGPDLLSQAEAQLARAKADASLVVVPDEARAIHGIWTSAQQLAGRALLARRAAIRSGDLQQAWEASAAAAGALLLLQQLRVDVPALVRPPTLPVTGA